MRVVAQQLASASLAEERVQHCARSELNLRAVRGLIAQRAERLAELTGLPRAEALVSHVLPLADACRFLERQAHRILAPRRLSSVGRPLWLWDVELTVYREPFGTVLIIAPSNNRLFLPAVQTLQALAAGNSVLLKPGRGGQPAAEAWAQLLYDAGLPAYRLRVLDESVETARLGADLVVFTGSAETGRRVLSELADDLTPAIMELSGHDAVFVRADADVDLVVRALVFGAQLGGGAVCMRPRRIYAHEAIVPKLTQKLGPLAENGGWTIESVRDDDDALHRAAQCPYALGASVFGREPGASALARRVPAGAVTVNDIIVPTADPRFPFGGWRHSGFGVTRGAEGLLAMTRMRVVATRRGRARLHLEPQRFEDGELFNAWIQLAHGRDVGKRVAALKTFFQLAWRRMKS
ncbi:MAG: aldehyde dehydrogenase family protein [Verrucomicrobiae bacterium]|nr:aldehyde dehydrogenase family protein [Verrucomicrobiae bacterium]